MPRFPPVSSLLEHSSDFLWRFICHVLSCPTTSRIFRGTTPRFRILSLKICHFIQGCVPGSWRRFLDVWVSGVCPDHSAFYPEQSLLRMHSNIFDATLILTSFFCSQCDAVWSSKIVFYIGIPLYRCRWRIKDSAFWCGFSCNHFRSHFISTWGQLDLIVVGRGKLDSQVRPILQQVPVTLLANLAQAIEHFWA